MNNEIKIGIIGGDERQLVIAQSLCDIGFEVAVFGFGLLRSEASGATKAADLCGAVAGSAAVVLPLPPSRDGIFVNCPLGSDIERKTEIHTLFGLLSRNQLVIGGNFSEELRASAAELGIKLCDYYKREEISILNAVPTAEGALSIAMRELPVTVYGSEFHILGFGRIGKVLAKDIHALGGRVTVHARSQADLAWIRIFGYRSADITELGTEKSLFEGCVAVFNTVPKIILTEDALSLIPTDAIIIDLASDPGGADPEAALRLGKRYVRALSLPGKTAPVSSGRILSEGIFGILQREGITP